MKKSYTSEELGSLLEEVSKDFSAFLAKSEDESEKKDPKEEGEKQEMPKDESKKMDSEMPKEESMKEEPKKEMSEGKESGEAPESKMPMEGEKQGMPAEDHGYDQEDMDHMHQMYSTMSKGELKAHHDIIRKCMDGMGFAKCESGMAKAEMEDAAKDAEGFRPNGGPSDGEAASTKTPKASDTQALEKSEKGLVLEVSSDKEIALIKSELQIAKSENEKSKKELEAAVAFITKFVEKTAPAGRAITSTDIIAKTENVNGNEKPLSKSEIMVKLSSKAKDPTLSKSDRDAITSYCLSKSNISKVSHLLK